jgi:TonB family protein
MPELPAIQSFIDALGWMLIHFLWQGCAIAGAYWVVCKLARPDSAQLRYWAGLGAYLATALVPAFTIYYHLRPAGQEAVAVGMTLPAVTVTTGYHMSAGQFLQQALEPALPLVVVLWAIGVTLMSSRTIIGWMGTRRMTRVGVEPVGEELRIVVSTLVEKLGIRQTVTVLRSTIVAVPTVIGWLKPVILLPASVLAELPRAQMEMIIAHELAHVRRNDYLVNLLQVVIETLFFYHPAVRWMASQVRAEREHCCDDLVVEQCGRPVQYARALASLEALRGTPQAPALGANGGDLFYRVSRIVRQDMPRRSSGYVQVALATAVAVTASLGARQGMEMGLALSQPATPVAVEAQSSVATRAESGLALGEGLRQFNEAERLAAAERQAEEEHQAAADQKLQQRLADQARAERESEQRREQDRQRQAERLAGSKPAEQIPEVTAYEAPVFEPVQLASAKPVDIAHEELRAATEPTLSKAPVVTAHPVTVEPPDYPYRAFRNGVEGHVKLQFTVDERGRARDIKVIEAYPEKTFDSAAVKAMKKWRFELDAGHNASQRLFQTFEFAKLPEDEASQQRSRRCNRTGSNICGQHYSDDNVERFDGGNGG